MVEPSTAILPDVLHTETDSLFDWQFDSRAPCPKRRSLAFAEPDYRPLSHLQTGALHTGSLSTLAAHAKFDVLTCIVSLTGSMSSRQPR